MPDWATWTPYLQSALALTAGWLVKNQIAMGKDVVEIRTTMKYYIERQTEDAARRLNVANPAPPDIRALVQKHIHGEPFTREESDHLIDWLRWTGKGQNPDADSAERSAALQLLTGIKTKALIQQPKRRWWRLW